MLGYETFGVSRRDRQPLIDWMVQALEGSGCRMLHVSTPDQAPFRLTFETALGERLGIVAYAFLANSRVTKTRPADEHRFQIKYGTKSDRWHEIWQDPFELYTTLFFGIDLKEGFFVAADPVLHDPTRFFISLEFKAHNVEDLLSSGWTCWERTKRDRRHNEYPTEVLVGGTPASFLRLIRLERAAKGLDPGHRQLLADKLAEEPRLLRPALSDNVRVVVERPVPHAVAEEFELSQVEILDLIESAPRLKMAVRGWVAESHLHRQLLEVPGVEDCVRLEGEGQADIGLRYQGSRPLTIECKNVLRQRLANGTIRLDFQRTRASKSDPCSRFYAPDDFDMVAACLHSCTEAWEFRYSPTSSLEPHRNCDGKLDHRVRIDDRWIEDVRLALSAVA